jgi:hypothetical protein
MVMLTPSLAHVSVFPGWIAGVTYRRGEGYRCWVINPDFVVLNDGEVYPNGQAAIAAGRLFIHHSLEVEADRGHRS